MAEVEIWRGGVAPWECDQMGHLNIRFHFERAGQGLAALASALGMPRAFAAGATANLLPLEHHLRFLREARVDAALSMTGGVLDLGEDQATLLQVLLHQGGEPATAFVTRVAHAAPDGRAFPWSSRTRAKAQALRVERPRHAAVRSASQAPPGPASAALADELGLAVAGLGVVTPAECDVSGRLTPAGVAGRIAAGVSSMVGSLRSLLADAEEGAFPPMSRVGGAIVEYRAAYRAWPRAGDGVVVRAGLAGFDSRTRRMVYWLLDPDSGQAWATAEMVSLSFDLETRKALVLPEPAVEKMRALVTPGLAI